MPNEKTKTPFLSEAGRRPEQRVCPAEVLSGREMGVGIVHRGQEDDALHTGEGERDRDSLLFAGASGLSHLSALILHRL